jgi:hypothetical protein
MGSLGVVFRDLSQMQGVDQKQRDSYRERAIDQANTLMEHFPDYADGYILRVLLSSIHEERVALRTALLDRNPRNVSWRMQLAEELADSDKRDDLRRAAAQFEQAYEIQKPQSDERGARAARSAISIYSKLGDAERANAIRASLRASSGVDRKIAALDIPSSLPVADAIERMKSLCASDILEAAGDAPCVKGMERAGEIVAKSTEPQSVLLTAANTLASYATRAGVQHRRKMEQLVNSLHARGLRSAEIEISNGRLQEDERNRLQAFERAVSIEPDNRRARLLLSEEYLRAGRYDDSRREAVAAKSLTQGLTDIQRESFVKSMDSHLDKIEKVRMMAAKRDSLNPQ